MSGSVRDVFRDLGRRLAYVYAPLATNLLGWATLPDRHVPEGQALVLSERRTIVVGIPSRDATIAALIVRDGLADVLAWLGQPARPLALQVAASHYGLDDEVVDELEDEDEVEFDPDDPTTYPCAPQNRARGADCGCSGTGLLSCPGWDA